VNNRAYYRDYKALKCSEAGYILTAAGKAYPTGIGTAVFQVLISYNPLTYRNLELKEALFLPTLETNIVSGIRYYGSGGTLLRQQLFTGDRTCCSLLNFEKYGFYL
jgi:hypothetical protein